MNEFIIDPNWIYTWHVCDGLYTLFMVFLVFIAIGFIIITVCYVFNTATDEWIKEANKKACFRWVITLFILVCIFSAGVIFIPNKETMMEMTVAKFVTKNNINWTVDQIKELAEYIVGLL